MPAADDLSRCLAVMQCISVLHDAYRSGRINPADLFAGLRERIRETMEYNAWITVLDEAQVAPYIQGLDPNKIDSLPLFGVPFAIKDNIDLAGVPTTAACPEYSYVPERSAFVVQRLIEAGAVPVGKTNLDQFATGLSGTRSPYGITRNSINSDYIAGGSSSGSAVATALKLVIFALGTDTAGSGRVPAAFNGIIGVKPTRGLVSMTGVVPACRSLDTVSVFTRSLDDAARVNNIVFTYDPDDPYAKTCTSRTTPKQEFVFGVPAPGQLEFFGDTAFAEQFDYARELLLQCGGREQQIDFTPFIKTAGMLYAGPWVAERYIAVKSMLEKNPDALLPVTREIIERGAGFTAEQAFRAGYELQSLKQLADRELRKVDFVMTPTCGTMYRMSEMLEQPVQLNTNLGFYTNFMNLLDYSAIAVPAGETAAGLPFGVTLFSHAGCDNALIGYASKFLSLQDAVRGMLTLDPVEPGRSGADRISLVVCGAHLSDMPLNYQLLELDAVLERCTATAPCYRLYALGDGSGRPGLVKVADNGTAIAVEVWSLPVQQIGKFMQNIPGPLCIGSVELAGGVTEKGFLCESWALTGARDISGYGGWKAYVTGQDSTGPD